HFVLNLGRNSWIVLQVVKQTLLILFVILDDFATSFVRRFRVVVIFSNVVRTKRTVIVRVCLAVGNRVILRENIAPTGVEQALKERIAFRVVSLGFGKRDPVLGVIAHADAKTVRLHTMIAFSV